MSKEYSAAELDEELLRRLRRCLQEEVSARPLEPQPHKTFMYGVLLLLLMMLSGALSTKYSLELKDVEKASQPLLTATLIIIAITFGGRFIWLCYVIFKKYMVIHDDDPFRPERFSALAFTIFILGSLLAIYMVNDSDADSVNGPNSPVEMEALVWWLLGLLFFVPLVEVYGGSWGKIKAFKGLFRI